MESDCDLLLDLAHAAEQLDAPGRRGHGGLMTPSVTQMVEEAHALSSRSTRRDASGAIRALRDEAERGRTAVRRVRSNLEIRATTSCHLHHVTVRGR